MDEAAREDSELQRTQALRAVADDRTERRGADGSATPALERLRKRGRGGQATEAVSAVLGILDPAWRDNKHDVKWFATLEEIVRFRETHGFLPRYNGDLSREKRLYQWLNSRRKEGNGAGAGAAKFARQRRGQILDERLAGWDDSRDGRWLATLDEIVRFRALNGLLPQYGGALPGERRLFWWLNNRRTEANGRGDGAAKFARERRDLILDERLPGWRGKRHGAQPT